MSALVRIVFVLILLFSAYHLVRDVMQFFGIENAFTNVLHWTHRWCGGYCDMVSIPLETVAIIGALIVLARGYVGIIGFLTMCFPPFLLLMTLLLP